jgi:hypothetical protein
LWKSQPQEIMTPITRSQARRLAQQNQQKKEVQNALEQPEEHQDAEIKLSKKNTGRKRKNHKVSKEMKENSEEVLPPIPCPPIAIGALSVTSHASPPDEDEKIVEITKKIKLSDEELTLNGAPEGELFDVAVLLDDSLTSLTSPELELTSALSLLTSPSATWASRHQSIEIIRRGCRYHSELFSQDQVLQIFRESCLEIESLRSCVSRNGIYCLRALYQLSYPWSDTNTAASAIYERSIHLLMNKSSSGPKFLCQLAIESLEFGVRAIPWSHLISILQPFNSHRNAEISSRSYSLVANRILLPSFSSSSSPLSSLELQTQYSQYLTNGLHSLRPQSREVCKKALVVLFRSFGHELSKEIVEQSISSERKAEVLRLVEESLKKAKSSSSGNKENSKERNRPPIRPVWKSSKPALDTSSSTATAPLII